MQSFRLVAIGPRHKLYLREDTAEHVYLVRAGLLKLVRYSSSGEERIVRLARRGDALGLESLLGRAYHHSACAMTHAEVCRVPAHVVRHFQRVNPRITDSVLAELQASLDAADLFLTELSTGSTNARVARLLLYLAENQHDAEFLLMTREEMGALLGVTRESVSRALADFRRSGIVDCSGDRHVRACDADALAEIAAS